MVLTKNVDNRWMKRYKVFLLFGTLLLCLQVYLAYKFLTLNHDGSGTSRWSPHRILRTESEGENSVNSARRARDGPLDDEDVRYTKQSKKPVTRPPANKTNLRLRLEELDFAPDCFIMTRDAISAIHRARTQKCKQAISNVTCLIQWGKFYPKSLPSFCDAGGRTDTSLGCFKDAKSFRTLTGYYTGNVTKNSPEYCKYLCLQSGFLYAGVEFGTECFCGDEDPPVSAKLPDSSCNIKCPGDPHLVCGGHYTINIYQTGIKKFTPQQSNVSSTVGLAPSRIAFLLTLNGRALRQVKRLLKNIYHKDHYYYIHVDIRQDYLFRELLPLERQFSNIRLTRKRFATIWGGASLLEMLLSTMHELTHDHVDWRWDFVINLSESDYPVKTVRRLVDFLGANRDRNFVKSHGREAQRFIQKQGLDRTFIECDTHMWRIGERKLPYGIQIDGGSDWVALSRRFVGYVVGEEKDELLKGLILVFGYTLLPAESFFHTVLRNSRFCDSYVDNNLHVTNWKRKLGCKCQYKHIVDWCGCSPNDFKPDDWIKIISTEPKQIFFARKFEPIINQAVILQLEQWLYGKNFSDVINVNSYWQSLYNYKDRNQIEDALLTVVKSIIRAKMKSLSRDNCSVSSTNIVEVTSHHINDTYRQTLVLLEIAISNKVVNLEFSFRPKDLIVRSRKNSMTTRLRQFHVSTDYDPKELISRNFARTMGPYSEPTLVYEFSSDIEPESKAFNFTFLWTDPTGRPVDVNEVTIDDGSIYGHVKTTFKQPLIPGTWHVLLIYKREEVARTSFLVSPLSYFAGNEIQQNQVKFVHSGSGVYREVDVRWERYTVSDAEQESLEQLSVANSKRFGPDLEEWIDHLVNRFYSIGDVCAEVRTEVCGEVVEQCNATSWSSMAPDPKSTLSEINRRTGMFELF